jgi:hypothetical protein
MFLATADSLCSGRDGTQRGRCLVNVQNRPNEQREADGLGWRSIPRPRLLFECRCHLTEAVSPLPSMARGIEPPAMATRHGALDHGSQPARTT